LFNSSPEGGPFQNSTSKLFLPPSKSERLRRYEQLLADDQLGPSEYPEYQALAREYQARFWTGDGMSVEQALSGVKTRRGERLSEILQERGLSNAEQSIFFTLVKRDRPSLLEDRD
jgi:hypothetical protein